MFAYKYNDCDCLMLQMSGYQVIKGMQSNFQVSPSVFALDLTYYFKELLPVGCMHTVALHCTVLIVHWYLLVFC